MNFSTCQLWVERARCALTPTTGAGSDLGTERDGLQEQRFRIIPMGAGAKKQLPEQH